MKNDGSQVNLTLTDAGALTVPGGTTLTAPHFTSPVVDSGGLTVTLGGATIIGLIQTPSAIAFTANWTAPAPGQVYKDAAYGLAMYGTTGSVGDWVATNRVGSPAIYVATGTTNVVVVGSLSLGGGTAITNMQSLPTALTPVAVAANTTAEQLFTVTGLATNDKVFVNKPTAQAGLGIVGFRVAGVNSLGITFSNNTAAAITPTAAETYQIVAIRS